MSDVKGIISLPHDSDGRPIAPKDFSAKWPTVWYHNLSNNSLLKVLDKLESVDKNITDTFKYPVNKAVAPDYDTVIKDRLDLTTVRCRIKSGIWYYMGDQYLADIDLIVQNCKEYNKKHKFYVNLAGQLKREAKSAYDSVSKLEDKLKKEEAAKAKKSCATQDN